MIRYTLSRKRNYNQPSYNILSLLIAMVLLINVSCKSTKPLVITSKKQATRHDEKSTNTTTSKSSNTTIDQVVHNALSYKGTKYKYGGNTRRGIDCSGLIHVSFLKAGKNVPRTSTSLYSSAQPIDFNKIDKGDLLFFATGNSKRVNHVGMVVSKTAGELSFVHASSSRGVMVSTMNERYWINAYIAAGRIE